MAEDEEQARTCPACGGDGDEGVSDEDHRRCRWCGGKGVLRGKGR